jgi:hypothetical protein
VPQIPFASTASRALCASICGRAKLWTSIVIGPVSTAARTRLLEVEAINHSRQALRRILYLF